MEASREVSVAFAFEVLNGGGETLRGVFDTRGVSPSTCPPFPDAVVLCHGFRSSRKSRALAAISESLTLPTVAFDFSGNGDSGGEFQYGNYAKEVEDLRSIVEWVQERGYRTKGILGHSKGGNVVLLYGAKYDDVDRIVNISGRCSLTKGVVERIGKEGLEKIQRDGYVDMDGYKITSTGLRERLTTDMSQIERIQNANILHVHGSADEVSPASEAVELQKQTPGSKLNVVEGADHSFSNHRDDLLKAVIPFLEG